MESSSGMLLRVLAQAQDIAQRADDLASVHAASVAPTASAPTSGGFASLMGDVLHRVDGQEQAASEKMRAVEAGESDDLVGAMLASQQANLSFSMLLQARNKIAGALDELIKLQI
ncbi:MAG TPA: flagellar hook-basal body complex protein FliE [Burkholderiaceae bacterium]|nr:flagellar hook-basal body complex protein FliE [Burkholderiaceae bacterium]